MKRRPAPNNKITGGRLRFQNVLHIIQKHAQSASRKPRRDAQRNRERILEVAKKAFARAGTDVSLDDIARQAGVFGGTLAIVTFLRATRSSRPSIGVKWRNSRRRHAAFAVEMPPIEVLRAWMLPFVDHIAAKLIIAQALNSVVGGVTKFYREGSRGKVAGFD